MTPSPHGGDWPDIKGGGLQGGIAFPSLQISHLCVFCDILDPKAVYRVSRCFSRPKMFSPGDRVWYHSCTLGSHVLATVVGPSPNGPQFCHIRCIRPQTGWLRKQALNRLPNQPHAQWPPPHQPLPHTLCPSCKLNMCKVCYSRSLPFLWTPNNICVREPPLG